VACDELLPEPLPRASGGRNGNLAERGPPADQSQQELPSWEFPLSLEFDAPDIDSALKWGTEEIEARADLLAAVTLNRVELHGLPGCTEITPGKPENLEAIITGQGQPEPTSLTTQFLTDVMGETFLRDLLSPALLRSFRWFRKGLAAELPEDAYFCFWIALEVIGGVFASDKKRHLKCPKCQHEFHTCPECNRSTETRAVASDGIIAMFAEHLGWPKGNFDALNRMRSKLTHGNVDISAEFREELVARTGDLKTAIVRGYEVLLGLPAEGHWFANRVIFPVEQPYATQLRVTFNLPAEEAEE
jgi:hypothetical protein